MLTNAREMITSMIDDGDLKGSVIGSKKLSIDEMVEIICLMAYYFRSHNDVYQECLALFERNREAVDEKVMKLAMKNADGEYGVEMALASAFLKLVEKNAGLCKSEEELVSVVERMRGAFFGGVEDVEEEESQNSTDYYDYEEDEEDWTEIDDDEEEDNNWFEEEEEDDDWTFDEIWRDW